MITIYHNSRCRKSREALEYLKHSGKAFEIVEYLKNPISEATLKQLIKKLGISPLELIRKNEAIWKSEFKDRDLSEKEIVGAMIQYPKLMERPIVENQNRAVIARPAEKIKEIL